MTMLILYQLRVNRNNSPHQPNLKSRHPMKTEAWEGCAEEEVSVTGAVEERS